MTHLRRSEWVVDDTDIDTARALVRTYHYCQGASNTACYLHGLFAQSDPFVCRGVAWWIPPTMGAAKSVWPDNPRGVLALSRLVIAPEVPTNGASFLLGASIKRIRQGGKWDCLVTYADEGQGHTGQIYRATNWEYVGKTAPEVRWVDSTGRIVARKAGPTTRTKSEMIGLGYCDAGRYQKHRFRLNIALNRVAQTEANLFGG